MNNSNIEKLNQLCQGQVSTWSPESEWRNENLPWMERSAQIALEILFRLEELGLTKKALAEKLCVSQAYVSKLVKGKQNLTLENISKIESALDFSLIKINGYQCGVTLIKMPYTLNTKYVESMKTAVQSDSCDSFVTCSLDDSNGKTA